MKQESEVIQNNNAREQPIEQAKSELPPQQKKKKCKKIVITVFVVLLGLICFCLSIVAMSAAVNFFSYMFSLVGQLYAKAYLKQHFSWFMAITYLAIFGFVIVVANTAVFFTQFSQKERIVWIHLGFYLAFLICGIVALVSNAQYVQHMTSKLNCNPNLEFQCKLSLSYFIFRGQVTSYFIGYCICFFAYAALYQYASYTQKREKQEKNINDNIQVNTTQNDGQNYGGKNVSNISFDQH